MDLQDLQVVCRSDLQYEEITEKIFGNPKLEFKRFTRHK